MPPWAKFLPARDMPNLLLRRIRADYAEHDIYEQPRCPRQDRPGVILETLALTRSINVPLVTFQHD